MTNIVSVPYRKRDGSAAVVVGEQIDLGVGVCRPLPAYGFRRAVWHFSYGYVSGFPVKDIMHWILVHSISPRVQHYFLSKRGQKCGGTFSEKTGKVEWCRGCYSADAIIAFERMPVAKAG